PRAQSSRSSQRKLILCGLCVLGGLGDPAVGRQSSCRRSKIIRLRHAAVSFLPPPTLEDDMKTPTTLISAVPLAAAIAGSSLLAQSGSSNPPRAAKVPHTTQI